MCSIVTGKHSIGPMPESSQYTQFGPESCHIECFKNNSLIFFSFGISHNVLPLQSHTYHEYWKYFLEGSRAIAAHAGPLFGSVSLPCIHL